MSVDDLKREVSEGWPDIPAGSLALNIIEFMSGLDVQELRMLTIPVLLKAVDRMEVDEEFLTALAILVSSTVHVLDVKTLLVDEDESSVRVEAKELANARKFGALAHPETGELIEDFESRLIPYFQSSERFLEARADG